MDKQNEIEETLNALFEKLAHIEHERWSHWQKYLHSKGERQADGSLLLPAALVEHWDRQMSTPYDSLDDNEKESDREQVRQYLPVITSALAVKKLC